MKRFTLVIGIVAGLALAGTALSSPGLRLDKQDLAKKQCTQGTKATQVVDVHYTLLNDSDSGFAGNFWANDTMDRHLRIWSLADGTYCVQVEDHGRFTTFAGASPGGGGTVTAGVKGEIEGGYITSDVVGTFAPTQPTHGNLGTFDLQCVQDNCPGAHPSWPDYFSSVSSSNDFAQWGWIYHAGKHGTWLNQDDVAAADSGDITG